MKFSLRIVLACSLLCRLHFLSIRFGEICFRTMIVPPPFRCTTLPGNRSGCQSSSANRTMKRSGACSVRHRKSTKSCLPCTRLLRVCNRGSGLRCCRGTKTHIGGCSMTAWTGVQYCATNRFRWRHSSTSRTCIIRTCMLQRKSLRGLRSILYSLPVMKSWAPHWRQWCLCHIRKV